MRSAVARESGVRRITVCDPGDIPPAYRGLGTKNIGESPR